MAKDNQTGRVTTIASWAKDVVTLLPKTDEVAIQVQDGLLLVPWLALISIVGELLQVEPNLYPERFLVRSFPSEHHLEALRQVGTLRTAA